MKWKNDPSNEDYDEDKLDLCDDWMEEVKKEKEEKMKGVRNVETRFDGDNSNAEIMKPL
jgi:hypothetical protein